MSIVRETILYRRSSISRRNGNSCRNGIGSTLSNLRKTLRQTREGNRIAMGSTLIRTFFRHRDPLGKFYES